MTKKKYPIKKMGKHCGYEEYEDGSIKIAGSYSMEIDDLLTEELAVDSLMKSVLLKCKELLTQIKKRQEEFWDKVKDDYDLDLKKYDYTYERGTEIIFRKEKTKEEEKP